MSNQEWIDQAKHNSERIEREIGNLSQLQRKEFWEHVKEIGNMFKTLKPILREDRERLWNAFQDICETTKKNQKEEWEQRRNVSEQKRDLIESKIREAHYQVAGSHDKEELRRAKDLLQTALAWMKDGWGSFNIPTQLFTLNDGKMLKEDREACWSYWKEVSNELHYKQQDLWQERKRKHDEWRERMEGNVDRWERLIDKNEGIISNLEDQIDKLEDKARSARTDEFADTVRGWIEEKYDVINRIRESNRSLEEKIRSVRDKLNR